jgi:hypothetical protein
MLSKGEWTLPDRLEGSEQVFIEWICVKWRRRKCYTLKCVWRRGHVTVTCVCEKKVLLQNYPLHMSVMYV